MRPILLCAGLSLSAIGSAAADDALVAAAKAADSAAALALIQREVDVNVAEPDGTTPLHWAVHNGDVQLVERLIAAGADVSAANEYGATPMSEAAVVGNAAIFEALLAAGANADSPNAEGQTALMVVARSSNVDAAQVLLAHGADANAREARKGQTALMWAAAQSQSAMVDLLIASGAEVNARSTVNEWERQVTAEPRAKHLPSGGFTPLLYAARQGCLDCARALVAAGADIDMADPDGISPLLSALLNAHFDTAKYLVEAGANPNKWDWWGRNPLYAAVDYNTLPHGGRPDRPSLDDTTPLQMAELLLDKGANPNAQLKLFPALPQSAHGPRWRHDSRHRHDAAAARRASGGHRRDAHADRTRRARRLAPNERRDTANGRLGPGRKPRATRAGDSRRKLSRSRRPPCCSMRVPISTRATSKAARRCTRPLRRATPIS